MGACLNEPFKGGFDNFDKEYLFGFETLVFATSGISSMHKQLVTSKRKNNLKTMTPLRGWRQQVDVVKYLLLMLRCLAGVLGGCMGSFSAPFRWMVLSWITSLMFRIHSCFTSILEAFGWMRGWVKVREEDRVEKMHDFTSQIWTCNTQS